MEQPVLLHISSMSYSPWNVRPIEQEFLDELKNRRVNKASMTFQEILSIADKYSMRIAEADVSDIDINNVGQSYWLLRKYDDNGIEFGDIDPSVAFKYIYKHPVFTVTGDAQEVVKGNMDEWDFREKYDIKDDYEYKVLINFIAAWIGTFQLKKS